MAGTAHFLRSIGGDMKDEFYTRGKQTNVYNFIFIYKAVSLCLLCIATALLAFYSRTDLLKLTFSENKTSQRLLLSVLIFVLMVFISVITDFYILKKSTNIGYRLNRLAYLDRLTGLPNRYSCDLLFETFNDPERLPGVGFIVMKINNLPSVNKTTSHDNGNNLITEFCFILEDVGEKYGYIGRNGGNEFIILIENCSDTDCDMFLSDLTKRIRGYNEMAVGTALEIAYACVLNSCEKKSVMSELISFAYKKLKDAPQILS
ncbi:MAG: GGDEF domain-containing protein [Butyrivibrio sp.]|nr:GGDEF domain-containing protein [Butyrivibrio sp.]